MMVVLYLQRICLFGCAVCVCVVKLKTMLLYYIYYITYITYIYIILQCYLNFLVFLFACVFVCSLQENKTSNIPAPAPISASEQLAPCCNGADETFTLREYLMKP